MAKKMTDEVRKRLQSAFANDRLEFKSKKKPGRIYGERVDGGMRVRHKPYTEENYNGPTGTKQNFSASNSQYEVISTGKKYNYQPGRIPETYRDTFRKSGARKRK